MAKKDKSESSRNDMLTRSHPSTRIEHAKVAQCTLAHVNTWPTHGAMWLLIQLFFIKK